MYSNIIVNPALVKVDVESKLLTWMIYMYYLTVRSQVVKIQSSLPSGKQVTSNVIQGSVLGPLLLLLLCT